MHLRVNDAGQDGEPLGVDRQTGADVHEIADRGDLAGRDADIGDADAIMIDNDAAPQDQIKGLRHGAIPCYKAACVFDHADFGLNRSKIMNVIDCIM